MSVESFKGKLLEELLAYLIRNSGYRLLVDFSQDPDELRNAGSGLVVKGRGAQHQVDVLGQLGWVPAFTFPIRMFVEAKWHEKSKTGLKDVRNAVGVLQDINQNYVSQKSADGRRRLIRRFNYTYSLFSTTGFSPLAAEMALAHLISLVDLSGAEFADLRLVVSDLGSLLYPLLQDRTRISAWTQRTALTAIRERLGTWPEAVSSEPWKDEARIAPLHTVNEQFEALMQRVRAFGELFVGMANGPFLLVLKASEPDRFIVYADIQPTHEIRFTFEQSPTGETQGKIRPQADPAAYTLSFGLPRILEDHILLDENRGVRLAPEIKRKFLSEITVYRRAGNRDFLYRLTYDPKVGRQEWANTRDRRSMPRE
jgi:hypothetical protein